MVAHDHLLGVLLGLEEGDVHLGHEEAGQLHRPAQAEQRAERHGADGVACAQHE